MSLLHDHVCIFLIWYVDISLVITFFFINDFWYETFPVTLLCFNHTHYSLNCTPLSPITIAYRYYYYYYYYYYYCYCYCYCYYYFIIFIIIIIIIIKQRVHRWEQRGHDLIGGTSTLTFVWMENCQGHHPGKLNCEWKVKEVTFWC